MEAESVIKEYKRQLKIADEKIRDFINFFSQLDAKHYAYQTYGTIDGKEVDLSDNKNLCNSLLVIYYLTWRDSMLFFSTNSSSYGIFPLLDCSGLIRIEMSKYLDGFKKEYVEYLRKELKLDQK